MLGQLVVTVEQICTSLAHVFNIILHEGNVPLNSNKQGSINKTNNYMPVSLTSVTCKLLGKQTIGGISQIIYLDFQKAFDKVPHERLILNLISYCMGNGMVVSDGEVSNC